jgi:microcystin synthetase protein McyJ
MGARYRTFEIDRALLHRGGRATGWGNLGDWGDARTCARGYGDACEALAARVGRAARLGRGDEVLEAACGEGEGLRLWLERFGVHRVIGVELHPESAAAARSNLAHVTALRWCVETGSATDLSAVEDASVDAVVCVDAAYHFDARGRFLQEAMRVLRPGGRLALSDLVLEREPRGRVAEAILRGVAVGAAIPRANLCAEELYVARLRAAGFVDVALERLDAEVLGGFSSFVRAHRREHLLRSLRCGWSKVLVTGWGAGLVHRRGWMHYVMVSANAGGARRPGHAR